MHIDGFVWLPDILDKLAAKHSVSQDEVEEVFFGRPRYRFGKQVNDRGRMSIRPWGRRMQVGISLCSSSTNQTIPP